MSTEHDLNTQTPSEPRRPGRCLRHHVWMAACGECRDVRAPRLVRGREDLASAR